MFFVHVLTQSLLLFRRDLYWEGGEGYEDLPPGHPPMEEGQLRPIPPGPGGFWPNPPRGPPRIGHAMGLPPPPQYFPAGHMQMGMANPSIRKPETLEDRHVIAKHAELYPSVRPSYILYLS